MGVADYFTVINIGGTDVTAYVEEASFTDTALETVDSMKITMTMDILNSGVALTPGSEITMQRGTSASNLIYLFRGFITENAPSTVNVMVTAKNKLWALKQRQVTKSFDKNIDTEAGKLSEMILTLVTQYGGLNADSSTIQDSGTTFTLNKYLCVNDEVFERVMKLVDALGWQLYYNPRDDKVYCEEYGFRAYSGTIRFGLTSSTINLLEPPTLNYDYTDMVNKVTVNGAKQLDTKTELFSGDDSTKTFTLTYTPQQTKVLIGSTEQTRGVKSGDTTTFDYWVEEDLKQIVFVTAPTTGSDNVSVEYSAMVPVPVVLDDPDSIDLYCPVNPTTGEKTPFHKTVTFTDIIDVQDAINRGQEYLATYSTPFIDYQIEISQENRVFFPGQKVTIIDELNGYTGELVVNEVLRQYPFPSDIIKFTDNRNFAKNLDSIIDRIRKLEQETLRNIGTLFHIKRLTMLDVDAQRRYTKMNKVAVSGTGGIFGHPNPTWGVFGTATFGAPTLTTVTERIIQGEGTYREYLYDDDFIDTSNSTATLDTTNRRIYP